MYTECAHIPGKYSYSRYENNQPSTSILRQSTFGTQNAASAPSTAATKPNLEALVNAVVQDMTGGEKGGQWLLSCYAPFKETPAFPGFEDQSPEEIRLGFYEAQKTGTVEQYVSILSFTLELNTSSFLVL